MDAKRKYFVTGIILSFHLSVFGQFNTLTPTLPKRKDNPRIAEQIKDVDNMKTPKDKKSWKEIFKITTKTHRKNETEGSTEWLKSQIDSLKAMIKENSTSNTQKWNFKKTQDSMILKDQRKVINNFQNNIKAPFGQAETKTCRAYDSVNEPIEQSFSKIVMPLNREISVTSRYGTRTHPIFGISKFHNGIDLKANYENVYSVLDGIVTQTGWDSKGGGNYIKIKHFNRFETVYLHLSEIYYHVGEHVKAGFIIAKSGNSGNSTGPHLHFSVKEFGQSINPSLFLNDLIKANQLIATYYAK
ncbi:M23 family metallopeptidase [Chryseobacterium sp. EO14]|uniref:M23 family metallopeptidase n=1 Tax=Chryseobacterium sp. EO14 TaxID=2950551 RepID=UPI00210BDAF3|nr:M23 family metallopeptidase [Chryseobacterium sp. EO14]MCQ4139525.1 M23 family metallopeptidase [Chryseobacterium sp. EO14]